MEQRLDPLDALAQILHVAPSAEETERLARAVKERRIDWDATLRLAHQHLLAPALWPAMVERNLAMPPPAGLRGFLRQRAAAEGGRHYLLALEDDHRANAGRNDAIRRQALNVIATLNAAGIEPAVLKGTRIILAGDAMFAAAFGAGRVLRDIDLVIAPAQWAKACQALNDAGYSQTGEASHAVAFSHPEGAVELDLHRQPIALHRPLPLPGYLQAEGFWRHTEALALPALRCRQLPAGKSLVHAILHTEVADLNFAAGDWPLRYLYETAFITRRSAAPLDWSPLRGLESRELQAALDAHLHAAHRLFGARLPPGFSGSASMRRHYWRCAMNARHPRSFRRANILLHKLRQAMTPWYLARKGFYRPSAGEGLPAARLRALGALSRRHLRNLPRLLFGGDDSGLPPPRV
jgi:hypothetical protein